ncbi:hypothetical protein SASPL_151107 [Salvia splendens]|uniref:Uncharacterized protein n=1 Tax=Salvia splendens TaxID=180675 RepID=A0A8X8W7R1_SALSN|nr:hypothetical protein SASPL_151107 [Salvia splendens]
MNPAKTLARIPAPPSLNPTNIKWNDVAFPFCHKLPVFVPTRSARLIPNSVRTVASDFTSAGVSQNPERENSENSDGLEENVEKVIYGCRFFAILAVWGSLIGSFLCFIKVGFVDS